MKQYVFYREIHIIERNPPRCTAEEEEEGNKSLPGANPIISAL